MVSGALDRFGPVAISGPEETFSAMRAIASTELLLALRKSSLPILIALLAGVSLLFTPAENAGYAILSVNGMRAAMPPGTRLIVAGIVMDLLFFPVILLTLGMGYERDRQLGISAILATSPPGRLLSAAARIFANALLVVALSFVLLLLLGTTIFLRERQLPSLAAIGAFLLVTLPAGLLGISIASAVDRWLGRNLILKSASVFAAYLLGAILSVVSPFDLFGVRLLKDNLPAAANSASFSIGIVSASGLSAIPVTIDGVSLSFLFRQGGLVLLSIAVAALVAWLSRYVPGEKEIAPSRQDDLTQPEHALQLDIPRFAPQKTNAHRVAWILLQRWLTRSFSIPIVAAAALLLSLANPHALRAGPAVALLLPLLVANRGHLSAAGLRDLELCTSSLWRPAPTIFAAIVLAAAVVMALCPVLFAAPLLASLHLLVGVVVASLWLVWTCALLDRPLLGISIYSLLWYIECFSTPPPAFDLLGIEAGSGLAFAFALTACALLAAACLRGDASDIPLSAFLHRAHIPMVGE
jgi:hypothetical protein